MIIESKNNKLIKEVKSLEKRKNRESLGLFLVEGINMLEEIIDRGYAYKYILYSQNMAKLQGGQELLTRLSSLDRAWEISQDLMTYISDTQAPQGLLAVCPKTDLKLDELRPTKGTYLYLDRIQDPGNMGTIIRSADAFGIEGIILGQGSVDPYNQKVVRATMGAIFRCKLYWSLEAREDLMGLKEKGLNLLVTSLEASRDIACVSYEQALVVIGNEAGGVGQEILDLADEKIKISMTGNSQSLNAGVAAAIIMYQSSKK